MEQPGFKITVVVLSELVALWIIWRLWRSGEHVFLKVGISALALIPVVGPLVALWISDFPDKLPRILQDRQRFTTDVYDRWQHVLEDRNPVRRFRSWLTLMTKHRNEDP